MHVEFDADHSRRLDIVEAFFVALDYDAVFRIVLHQRQDQFADSHSDSSLPSAVSPIRHQQPNLPLALALARKLGWQFDIMSTSFFLSRRTLKPASGSSEMPRWQEHLYIGLARSANDATDYFQLPTGRVVEVGTQVAV